jgi:hypothetical protein
MDQYGWILTFIDRFFTDFELITTLVMVSSVFCDIMPYIPVTVNLHLGGTYRLHFQGRKVTQGRYQHEVGSNFS